MMKSVLYIITLLRIGFSQGRLHNADVHSEIGSLNSDHHFCGAPIFTDEYIENQREKMKNFYPEVYERMLMPPSLNKTYNIGMTEKFWVVIDDTLNAGEQIEVQITAQLLAKGTQVAIWADVNEIGLSNTNINATTATYATISGVSTAAQSLSGTPNLVVGIVTASNFVGDGSLLTGIVASGTGVVIQDEGGAIGTAGTINFAGTNVSSALSNGTATVTVGDAYAQVAGVATVAQGLTGSPNVTTANIECSRIGVGIPANNSYSLDISGDVSCLLYTSDAADE